MYSVDQADQVRIQFSNNKAQEGIAKEVDVNKKKLSAHSSNKSILRKGYIRDHTLDTNFSEDIYAPDYLALIR